MRWILAAFLFTLTACGIAASTNNNANRRAQAVNEYQRVLQSWQGVDLIVLERHQWFAYRKPEVRTLSDGTETWIYSNCRARQSSSSSSFAVVGSITTGGSSAGSATQWEECCHSQFFIRGRQVVNYQPSAHCVIDCTVAASGCQPR